ncbi:MAG: VPLPA-CTERM sorting domain-containing protein [Gammaproteobacteria bacterium]|nr:VPLPA-CTERM sorting domain-containing protein [Gammaproteobacteria bacterium]MBI5616592.1 VPLPA-CTERM sorting domain-containing protein [Gammaproteobacteria bacterium]
MKVTTSFYRAPGAAGACVALAYGLALAPTAPAADSSFSRPGIRGLVTPAQSFAPLLNPSFEVANLAFNIGNGPYSQVIAGGQVSFGSLADWTAISLTNNGAAGAFSPNLGAPNWTTKWWTGDNLGYVQTFGSGDVTSLSQVLGDVLLPNMTYNLHVNVGRRLLSATFDYSLQLFAGSELLASSSDGLNLGPDSFGTDTLAYDSGAANPFLGQALRIMLSTASTESSNRTEAFFDNVVLDYAPTPATVPLPAAVWLLGSGMVSLGALRRRDA